jgi:SAM-dependent methyltransferase
MAVREARKQSTPPAAINSPYPYDQVVAFARSARPRRVLDIGAGAGALVATLLGAGIHVEACDVDPGRLRVPGIAARKADLNCGPLPFADESFDAVTCCDVIEHLENPHFLFREFRRVLRPGGRAILSTPNILNVESRLRAFFAGVSAFHRDLGRRLGRVSPGEGLGHVNPIPLHELLWLGQAYGIPLERVGADYIPHGMRFLVPAASLIRLFTAFSPTRSRRRYSLLIANSHPVLFGYRLVLSYVKSNDVPAIQVVPARRRWQVG